MAKVTKKWESPKLVKYDRDEVMKGADNTNEINGSS